MKDKFGTKFLIGSVKQLILIETLKKNPIPKSLKKMIKMKTLKEAEELSS